MRLPNTTVEALRQRGYMTLEEIAKGSKKSLDKLSEKRFSAGVDPTFAGASSIPLYSPEDIQRIRTYTGKGENIGKYRRQN